MNTEIKKREYDGKFVLWQLRPAIDETEKPNPEYTPRQWVPIGVYDAFHKAQEHQRSLH